MKLNPKFWTKHQKVTGIVVCSVLVLGGISGGLVINDQKAKADEVAMQQAKTAKVEKQKAQAKATAVKLEADNEAKNQKAVTELMAKANQSPSAENIKNVRAALEKVQNESFVATTEKALKDIQSRLDLINSAKKAVENYQKNATSAEAQSQAKTAIDKLTNENDKAIKADLQGKYDESNRQAQEASKVAQAQAKAQAEQAKENSSKSSSSNSSSTNKGSTNSGSSASSNTSNSNSGNSSSSGWVNNSGSSSSGSTSKGNSSSSSSSSNNNSSYFVPSEGNTQKNQDAINNSGKNTQKDPSDWMGYK